MGISMVSLFWLIVTVNVKMLKFMEIFQTYKVYFKNRQHFKCENYMINVCTLQFSMVEFLTDENSLLYGILKKCMHFFNQEGIKNVTMNMMSTLESQADEIPIEELTLAAKGIVNTLSNLMEVLAISFRISHLIIRTEYIPL